MKCCVYDVLAHIYIFNGVQIVNWFVSYLYIHVLNRCCMGKYGRHSKILNKYLFLSSNEILVYQGWNCKILVKIANREDPDQTASSEAV